MIRINLLPDVILKQRQEERLKKLATYALIGWAGFLVVVTLLILAYKGFQTFRLNNAKESLAEIDARVNSPENITFRAEALAVQEGLNTLDSLFNTQQMPSEFIKKLASLTPSGVQLNNVSYKGEGSVIISGNATAYSEVSKFVASLKNSKQASVAGNESPGTPLETEEPYFDAVELVGANIADANQVSFELAALYISVNTLTVDGVSP